MNKLILVVGLVLLIGAGYFYFNKSSMMKKPDTVKVLSASTKEANVKEFSITAKQWSFDPALITVKQGDKVRLKIKSIDVAHGFGLPDFNISQNLEPGKVETVEFVADKKGEFNFRCNVICGQGHRTMAGKLVVE